MRPKKPKSLTMHLSEALPPIPGKRKQIVPLGVIAIRYLIVFDFLYKYFCAINNVLNLGILTLKIEKNVQFLSRGKNNEIF